jgi:hypothetical protein
MEQSHINRSSSDFQTDIVDCTNNNNISGADNITPGEEKNRAKLEKSVDSDPLNLHTTIPSTDTDTPLRGGERRTDCRRDGG